MQEKEKRNNEGGNIVATFIWNKEDPQAISSREKGRKKEILRRTRALLCF